MTLTRSIAIISLCFLLLPYLSGQDEVVSAGAAQLSDEQIHLIESMSVDSAGAQLDIPNVFTPNGDGTNDYLEVST